MLESVRILADDSDASPSSAEPADESTSSSSATSSASASSILGFPPLIFGVAAALAGMIVAVIAFGVCYVTRRRSAPKPSGSTDASSSTDADANTDAETDADAVVDAEGAAWWA